MHISTKLFSKLLPFTLSVLLLGGLGSSNAQNKPQNSTDKLQPKVEVSYEEALALANDSVLYTPTDLLQIANRNRNSSFAGDLAPVIEKDQAIAFLHPEYKPAAEHESFELISKREKHTKHFVNSDGSLSLQQGLDPLHFKDEYDNWITYDDELRLKDGFYGIWKTDLPMFVDPLDGKTEMRLDAEGNSAVFGRDATYTEFKSDGTELSRSTIQRNSETTQEDNYLTLFNAWNGIDRVQHFSRSYLETDYVINEAPNQNLQGGKVLFTEFVNIPAGWTIELGEGEETENGWSGQILVVNNAGETKLTFETPFYYDSNSDHSEESTGITGSYQYELNGSELRLSVVVSAAWLLSPERVYPVTIDPTASNSQGGNQNIERYNWGCSYSMNVNLGGTNVDVVGVNTTYGIRAQGGGWRSEQRSRILGPSGTGATANGAGNAGGVQNYNYNRNNTCSGIRSGNQNFTWAGYRTWGSGCGGGCCNQQYQRREGNWVVTLTYNNLCSVAGNPAVFGNNTWNVYAYNNNNYTSYQGFYVDGTLNFNTQSIWPSGGNPSQAAGYAGCPVGNDNHSFIHKRQGFPAGFYTIDLIYDDDVILLVNGVQVYAFNGCCAWRNGIWSGYLDGSSTVEMRVREYGGGSNAQIVFNTWLSAPSVGNGSVTTCSGTIYDYEGPAADYGNGANGFMVINPSTVGGRVILSGTKNTEGNYDYLSIWNGVGLVGNIYNSSGTANVPQFTSSDASGALTVRFTSDGSVTRPGFALPISCCTPQGDEVSYGTNQWIGYVYDNSNFTRYNGYVTQSNDFDQGFGGDNVNYPTNGCPTQTESFSVRYKNRRNFTCGIYRFRLRGDDGHRLSLDGGATWIINEWYGQGWGTDHYSGYVYLNGTYDMVLEYYEGGGGNRLTLNTESITPTVSASINQGASGTLCAGSTLNLTATGSSNYGPFSYSWSGPGGYTASGASMSRASATSGTYTLTVTHACGQTATDTYVLTTNTPPTDPTGITGTTNICAGQSTLLTRAGGTDGSGATYQWYSGTGLCGNSSLLGTGASLSVSPLTNTTYYVRRVASGANACTNTTSCASVTVNVSAQPTANAGVDQLQCNSNAFTISTASISGSGTLASGGWTWTLGGGTTATITNTNGLTPTITPTSLTGQVTMTLPVTASSPCTVDDSDQMVMTWSAAPAASAGSDIGQCGGANVFFTGSSASAGSAVSWILLTGQPGESGTGAIISGSGTDPTTWGFNPSSASGVRYVRLSATASVACGGGTLTDDLIITWDETPSVSVTSPQNSCTGTTGFNITGASASGTGSLGWGLASTSGTASITSGGTTASPTLTPTTTSGQYTLTLTSTGTGECVGTNPSAVMTANWDNPPVANAGSNFSACESTPQAMTGSSITGGAYSDPINWQQTGGTATGSFTTTHPTDPTLWVYTPTSAGTAILELRVTGVGTVCGSETDYDYVTITFDPLPVFDAGADLDVCYSSGAIAMSGASASNISSYQWSGGDPAFGSWNQAGSITAANFTPIASSGSFLATLSVDGNGACSTTSFTDTRTINWFESPTAIAGTPTTTCGTAGHGMGGSSASGTFDEVEWSTNPNGSWTTTNLTDPAQWIWTPSTPSGSFTSTLTVTGSGACIGTDPTISRLITWDAPPTVDAGTDIVACSGTGAITMTGATTANIGSYTWSNVDPLLGTWNQGASTAVATFTPANPSGQIQATLNVLGTGACSAINFSDDRQLDWTAAPVISAVSATDVTDCSNDNGTIVITATGDAPLEYSIDNGTSYQPSTIFDNLNDGVNYNIVVRDVNNCTTSYSGNPVVLNGPTVPVLSVATSNATCNGQENGSIDVTITSGGTAPYAIDVTSSVKTYLDTTAAIAQTANFSVFGGSYTITVTDRYGCNTIAGPYVIAEPSPISVSTTVVNNTNCTGTDGSITISASGGTPGFTYSFNGSGFTGTTSYTNLSTGAYPITVRDANNCDVSFEESIGGPFEVNAGVDQYLCSGAATQMNGQLDVNIDWSSQARSYTSTTIVYNPRNPGWTNIGLGDDQLSGSIGMPFTFNFYGNSYSNLYISSNGFITFSAASGQGCCTGQVLPTGGNPNNLVALCWEDLNPNLGGVIRYGTFGAAPNRAFVIEYNNIQHYNDYNNTVTGQIILFEGTNNIELHHGSVNADGGQNTFGIENENGTSGIGYRAANWWNTNTAYLFQPDPNVGTLNYTWSPSTGLSSTSIPNPTVTGLTSDLTYTLQVEIVGLCTLTDDVTVYVSDMASESSGTYGTAPNVSTVSNVVCNGDDDGCITVTPATGEAPYLLEGPAGEIQVYDGRMKELTVSNTTGATLTDYQVDMTVAYSGSMRADFGDIRFFDGTAGNVGDVLPYYVESYSLSSTARVFVKVPSIPNGGTTLYMTYGNAALSSQSDPDNTLLLYEDMMGAPSGTHYGNASYIDHQYSRLTQAINGVNGQLDYNLNPSTGGNGYVADFEFWIGGGNGADAIYQYSDCASRPVNEDAATGGYTFAYDTWQNQHQTKWNGATTATNPEANHDNSTWREARVEQFNTTGRMYLDGVLRLTGNVTADNVGNAFGFGARTGGANNEHRVRNIRVRKLVSPTPGVTFGAEELPNNQFCDLAPGTYSISVWDVAECSINEVSIPITEPTPLAITGIDVTDTWCYTTNNGELDLTVTGGTQITPPPPYLYTWAGPSSFSSTNEDLTGLNPGVYNITVVDDNACSVSSSATVNVATPISAPNFTWTGMTDQLWQDPTNWDCGIPDATSQVIIPAAPIGVNTPIIQNGIIGNVLNIDVQGTTIGLLEIQDGGLLRVFEP